MLAFNGMKFSVPGEMAKPYSKTSGCVDGSLNNPYKAKISTTGCPNKFGISQEMFASEASIVYKKVCISLHKIAFLAFFENCKYDFGIFKQLFSNCLM